MTDEENRELLRQEEERRNPDGDPAVRWKIIQEILTWIDAQSPVPRNSKQACLANQRRLLDSMGEKASNQVVADTRK